MALSLSDVRRVARDAGLAEIYFNDTSRVISFAPAEDGGFKRVNVYYTTGTVGTCVDHPRQGKTQAFRRNVDLALLQELFRNPRLHTGTTYQRTSQRRDYHQSPSAAQDPAPGHEEDEVLASLEKLRKEVAEHEAILEDFRKRRDEEARRAEKERERAAAVAAAAEEEARLAQLQLERAARGTRYKFWLREAARKEVDKEFSEATTCVAINEQTVFLISEGGGWSHTAGVPGALYDLLVAEKQKKRKKRTPSYVALGSNDRYYIRFTDGSSQWTADDDSFSEKVRAADSRGGVRSVTFGESDSWFIVYGDSGYAFMNIPHGLAEKLEARNKRGDLKFVSLGPDGEWCLAAENGRMWWNSGDGDSNLYEEIGSVKNRITYMTFGADGMYFVRYE